MLALQIRHSIRTGGRHGEQDNPDTDYPGTSKLILNDHPDRAAEVAPPLDKSVY